MRWLPLQFQLDGNPKSPGLLLVYGTRFPDYFGDMRKYVTDAELTEFSRSKNFHQGNTRIACRAVLRYLLCKYANLNADSVIIRKNKNGKPYLHHSDVHFNVSHNDSSFLIAISSFGRVGVDIEIPDDRESEPELLDYAFSEHEKRELESGTPFLEIWTRKEALLKAVGVGLLNNLWQINTLSLIQKWGLHGFTFTCPNNEIASLVTRTGYTKIQTCFVSLHH